MYSEHTRIPSKVKLGSPTRIMRCTRKPQIYLLSPRDFSCYKLSKSTSAGESLSQNAESPDELDLEWSILSAAPHFWQTLRGHIKTHSMYPSPGVSSTTVSVTPGEEHAVPFPAPLLLWGLVPVSLVHFDAWTHLYTLGEKKHSLPLVSSFNTVSAVNRLCRHYLERGLHADFICKVLTGKKYKTVVFDNVQFLG